MPFEGRFKAEVVDPDHARVFFPKYGPRNEVLCLRSLYMNADQVGKVFGLATDRGGHSDIALLYVDREIDEVDHVAKDRGKHAFQDGKDQRLGFQRRCIADEFYGYLLYGALCYLGQHASELFGQNQVGTQCRQDSTVDIRSVYRVADRPARQEIRYLVCYCDGDVFQGLSGGSSKVRRSYHLIEGEQGVTGRGLFSKHVKRSPGHAPLFDCLIEVLFVYDSSSCAVDDENTRFHFPEGIHIEQVAGFRCHGGMNR